MKKWPATWARNLWHGSNSGNAAWRNISMAISMKMANNAGAALQRNGK